MIPLKTAMITWRPAYQGEPDCEVVNHPLTHYYKWLPFSHGACYSDWRKMTATNRKLMLMIEAWHITCRDGVPLETIHNAMMVIPEYRDMLSEDFNLYNMEKEK